MNLIILNLLTSNLSSLSKSCYSWSC